jgi:hypothetical protein
MKELADIDIRHFKLSSGEDIITFVVKDDTSVVVVSQPMQMHSNTISDNRSYFFTDWQPMAKVNKCAISKLHIISFVECDDMVKEKYIRMCLDYDTSDINMSDVSDEYDLEDLEIDTYLSSIHNNPDKDTYH